MVLRRLAVLSALLLLALTGTASAGTGVQTITFGNDTEAQLWILESSIPTPDTVVFLRREPCESQSAAHPDALYSCVTGDILEEDGEPIYTVWLHPGIAASSMRAVLYHELFHVRDQMDGRRMPTIRRRFKRINGHRAGWHAPVLKSTYPDLPATVSERAADAAAWCGSVPSREWANVDVSKPPNGANAYGWAPTKAQFLATCKLLRTGR